MTYPSPRTWSAGDDITTPRLRGDMTNLASLLTSGRPFFVGANFESTGIGAATVTAIPVSVTYANNWNVTLGGTHQTIYVVPFAGWYLVTNNTTVTGFTSSPLQDKLAVGFYDNSNVADGGSVPGSVTNVLVGASGMDLYQCNVGDDLQWYIFTTIGTTLLTSWMTAEWVALPTSGLSDYAGPYGTEVSAPAAAALFPPGPGTTVTAPVTAGATSITVAANTGMVVNGTLGLDYANGQLNAAVAEANTITSVSGTTIGISAAAFPHSSGAPVAVPVSAAFLNQQCRDAVNFQSYPPILRAISSTTQTIASSSFPPTVSGNPTNQITTLGTTTVDNFGGFSGSGTYTFPLAGVYLVYGQIYYAGSTSTTAYGAGISISGGTIQWGTVSESQTSSGVKTFCMTVNRNVRVTAGQALTLWAYQGSGSGMATVSNVSNGNISRLIVVYRSL